jgi:hypothetical protein
VELVRREHNKIMHRQENNIKTDFRVMNLLVMGYWTSMMMMMQVLDS